MHLLLRFLLEVVLVVLGAAAMRFVKKRLNLDENSPAWIWIGWVLGIVFVGFAAFQVITGIQKEQYGLLYPWAVTVAAAVGFLIYCVVRGITRLWLGKTNGRR